MTVRIRGLQWVMFELFYAVRLVDREECDGSTAQRNVEFRMEDIDRSKCCR